MHLLGVVAHQVGQNELAVELISKALSVKSDYAQAHNNHGLALQELGRTHEAVASFQQALSIQPDAAQAHYNLGQALIKTGDSKGATSCFKAVLKLDAGEQRAGAEYALAHLGVLPAPSRTPEIYMKAYYQAKTAWWTQLGSGEIQADSYQGHALIADVLKVQLEGRQNLRILDAGCGTGMLGRFLRPYASALTGVDLAPTMLAVARQEGLYDRLLEDEMSHYLSQRHEPYQVIVSAAVLIHFSSLTEILGQFWNALEHGGTLALTVFVDEDCEEFSIQATGFFRHSPAYVKRVAAGAGFTLTHEHQGVHEMLGNEAIMGAVLVFQK